MEEELIVLVTYKETHRVDRYGYLIPLKPPKILVSHGVELETGKNIVLQQESPYWYKENCNAYFDKDIGEWVMLSKPAEKRSKCK